MTAYGDMSGTKRCPEYGINLCVNNNKTNHTLSYLKIPARKNETVVKRLYAQIIDG